MLVGENYNLVFTGAFTGANGNSVTLDAITSANTLVDYNIDVFATIFEEVGLTRSDYEAWLTGPRLIYTFRKGDVVYKVPHGFFTETPYIETVDYRQAALIVELPYLTAAEFATLSSNLEDINEYLAATLGVVTTARLSLYGATIKKPVPEADTLQGTRVTRREEALAARPTVDALLRTVIDYQVKLAGLEAIIIDQGIRT